MRFADPFERDGRDDGVRLRVDSFDRVGLVAGQRPERALAVCDLPNGPYAQIRDVTGDRVDAGDGVARDGAQRQT